MGGIGPLIGRIFTKGNFRPYAKRAGRLCLDTVFGTGCETFEHSIQGSIFSKSKDLKWWQIGKKYKQADFSNFWGKMKNGVKAMEASEAAKAGKSGSYIGKLWEEFKGMPKFFKDSFLKGKAKGGFMGGLKGFGGGLLKKMPLIGGIMMLIGHVPDITSAFKNGGIGAGLWETVKSGAKIGLDMGGFIIGQALIPIPFVGGIIGSIVIGGIGNKILGKGYKEKMAAKQNKIMQNMIDTNPYQQYQQYSPYSQYPSQGQYQTAYNWQPPQMNNVMNQQEYAYMMNQLYGPNNSLQRFAAYG